MQRLSRQGVGPSGSKRSAPHQDKAGGEDIVSPLWKHGAVHKRTGVALRAMSKIEWGDFSTFFKVLMQEKVTAFSKPVIISAHVRDDLDEKAMEMKTSVPIKGSLKNNGVEALEISAFV